LRELSKAILRWVEATLRDFARKSAIKYNSVQHYFSVFERIQIRSLKIRRLLFGFEENFLDGNGVALFSMRDSKKTCKFEAWLDFKRVFFSFPSAPPKKVRPKLLPIVELYFKKNIIIALKNL
jgi:hypothetical protein